MLDHLLDYGLFLAETVTVIVAFVIGIVTLAHGVAAARAGHNHEHIEVRNVNQRLRDMADALMAEMLDEGAFKRRAKQERAEDKARRKARKGQPARPRLFVLDFDGDLAASQTAALRQEISAILQVAESRDEVLLRLESPGGLVNGYGLAASELRRVREHEIKLTVAVDKVAASGGYMMACVADRILAAPFAVLGSIGVVAQLPNFHRLLKKNDIDIELHTAGEYKRTLTMLGENTEAARAKFLAELEDTHALFKSFVSDNRPQVAIAEVATGEHWYGARALALKLVDQIKTSDDYLLERVTDHDVYTVAYKMQQSLRDRLLGSLTRAFTRALARVAQPRLPGLPD